MPASLIIVWWGSDLSILGAGGRRAQGVCRAGEDPVAEMVRLLAAEFPGPGTARVLYQPDTLALHDVACPPAPRRRLRKLLATEFSDLNSRAAVWAAAPLRPARAGCATVLYLEPDSPLPRLRAELARRGIRLEGAWPLPALWEAERPPAESARGYLGVAASAQRALVFCLSPAGDRSIQVHRGLSAAEFAGAEIRRALARFDETERPRGCLAAEPGSARDALREALADCAVEEIPMADWLGRVRHLESGGLGDLLAGSALVHGGPWQCQGAAAVGFLSLAAAGWLTVHHRLETAAAQRAWAAQQTEAARAEETVSAREGLRERIDHLQGAWRTAQAPASRHYAFLVALARAAASTVALRSVQIAGDEFEIRGRADAEAGHPAETLLRFRRRLFAPGQPWRADPADEAPLSGDGEFALRGSWAPETAP